MFMTHSTLSKIIRFKKKDSQITNNFIILNESIMFEENQVNKSFKYVPQIIKLI